MFFFDFLLLLVGVLLGVAFFTLMERKVLGYSHFRKGPTKVLYFGVLQPISDAVKLFSKEVLKGWFFMFYFFLVGPLIGLFLMFFLWSFFISYGGLNMSFFSVLFMFCLLGLGVYFLLFSSWGSNSKYSLVGGYRSISQAVSYEVSLIFFVLVPVYIICGYDFALFLYFQVGFWFLGFFLVLIFSWALICMAESNRTPFDFSEGESELVSGFNVEFGGGFFSFIFICEYGMIIYLCFLSILLFFGGCSFLLKLISLCFFFVWVRCCFPRFRYDLLMSSAWKEVLPFVLFFFVFIISVF